MKHLVNVAYYASIVALLGFCLAGCGSGQTPPTASIPSPSGDQSDPSPNQPDTSDSEFPLPAVSPPPKPYVAPEVILETTLGEVRVRLHQREVPETVGNFLERYVDLGAYSNTIFHHVDSGVAVAGGYTADLTPIEIRAPIRNEAAKAAKNTRGTLAMVRSPEYADSAASQFYFNLADEPTLDYDEASENAGYCVFGEVTTGLDILDSLSKVEVHDSDGFPSIPVTPVIIKSIRRVAP
ncbi:MAG: peptidylprolyl isomerase A [Planctomycetaceae bacterium]|nr:peptidylprolyl isomerase A [Planctomycetaceae bacterium]